MSTSSVNIIYKTVYYMLHYFYIICKSCHEFIRVNKLNSQTNFSKLPQHVTILLGTEKPSLPDLVNLIEWCLNSGIPFISFYDYQGMLKKIEDKFILKLQEKQISNNVIWHNHPEGGAVTKNGSSNFKIHVKIISNIDGKNAVVDLCKQWASFGEETNLSIDTIDRKLKGYYKFPDPDLGICCGESFSIYGYPPWEIRITEFFRLDSHHNLTFKHFVKLLAEYSKCEQRLGR